MGSLGTAPRCEDRRAIEELLRRSGSAARASSLAAELLIREFGSFAATLDGSTCRLRRAGADDRAIKALRWCRSAVTLALRQRAMERPVMATSSALHDYLRVDMGNGNRERFRTLHLNVRNELLLDDEAVGTIDAAPFYAREIIGRAIEVGASSLILVHNHPSGDARPSRCDVDATVSFSALCQALGITLLDHLIVGCGDIVSLRSMGVFGA